MAKSFDILVMDENYEILSILNYNILQWTRKYYESGSFSIYIPIETYDSRMKYVYTKDRPEVGIIEQVNYFIDIGIKYVVISGYFLENLLSRMIVYQKVFRINTNMQFYNDTTLYKGKAEDVATRIFNDFKSVYYLDSNFNDHEIVLDIVADASKSRGKQSEHTRQNEYLSNKIYSILKPSRMSYRVYKDWTNVDSNLRFKCWVGKDRTEQNKAGNKPVIFSTKYGNIIKADVLISSIDYRNAYLVTREGLEEEYKWNYVGTEDETERNGISYNSRMIHVLSGENASDYEDDRLTFFNVLASEGHERLLDYPKRLSIDIDTIESNYEYITDYDLGDVCSIEIPEIGLSVDGVISGIYEVVKEGVMKITLEFTIQEER